MRGDHDTFWEWLDDFFAVRRLRRWLQRRWQDLTWGFNDSVTWNLDYQLAKWLLPRLKRFRQVKNGYPAHLTPEEWDQALDKMIRSLELVVHEDDMSLWKIKLRSHGGDEFWKKKREEADEGFKLLGQYIRHLWW